MGTLKKQPLKKKQVDQKLIDTLREIQRKKHLEQKIAVSQRAKETNLLYKEIKREINRKTNYIFPKLSTRLQKGVNRYIFIELNSFKSLNDIKLKDVDKIVNGSCYIIKKTKFNELFKTKKISKKQAKKELHNKLKDLLNIEKLSAYDKKQLGIKINEWFKKNNGSGSLTFEEFDGLDEYVFSRISDIYKERLYSYNTELIINDFFNQSNFKKLLKRRTREDVQEIKKEFKDYMEKTYKDKEINNKDMNKISMVLFKIITKY